ncbi:MAG: pyridoxal-phosphate-dependent aminotransferase family protein [Terriglobia bacterium]
MRALSEVHPPQRILLAPGPSQVDARVYRALLAPVLGHLDPEFLRIMDDVQVLLRRVFQTENHLTFPVSGTGSAGMETAMANLLEPGDEAIVCVGGHFGARMAEMAARVGARVERLESQPGTPVDPERVGRAARGKKVKLIAIVHGETSTGVLQDVAPCRAVADECEALLVVDTVATLGGMPVAVDRQRIDVCFAASQKCLSAPPGLAPFTASPTVEEVLARRKSRVTSWYFDLTTIMKYWGHERTYHHTAPISMVYALREALRLVEEETLSVRWERHQRNEQALVAGLEALGLELLVEPAHRMWTVTAVKIPAGVNDLAVRRRLLEEFDIEIAGGLDELKGKIWRIGLMGTSSTRNNVLLFLLALEKILLEEGFAARGGAGAGVAAAEQSYLQTPAPAGEPV